MDKTFIKITNKDIYTKLGFIEKKITSIEQHAIKTNGKINLYGWMSKFSLSLIIIIIGWILANMGGLI